MKTLKRAHDIFIDKIHGNNAVFDQSAHDVDNRLFNITGSAVIIKRPFIRAPLQNRQEWIQKLCKLLFPAGLSPFSAPRCAARRGP